MKIYTILDKAANSWNTPFFQPTPVHAMRAFKMEVNRQDQSNTIYLYPEEYDLYYLGDYNATTGDLEPLKDGKQLIANGKQLKQETK